MAELEQLKPNTVVRGILPECQVNVVGVQWFGTNALELTYKDSEGKVANTLVLRESEPTLEIVEVGRPWSFDGDDHTFRLVSEAHSIRLTHLFDPVLAVHISIVEPLLHPITAIYEEMLSRQPCGSYRRTILAPERPLWPGCSSKNLSRAATCADA